MSDGDSDYDYVDPIEERYDDTRPCQARGGGSKRRQGTAKASQLRED
eukprot:CAMPEP_0174872914 /NCGR_PEP_ID=MMETSP1114-20130205/74048_1 /TAXON_ID=312471 /ORGANISM="Neobodo designis, Strain CCAP 1951/1" /LENGTH=46 /DNA_ID= /DNA_START= /DNA_END= /DNA_ORIENTATION=